jgi:four helix bundle protein
MAKENIIKNKSFDFAVRIVKCYKHLVETKKEFVMSKQLLRSGTAIGALIKEAEQAESRPDFIHKLNIALKEANETDYWLELLFKTNYLDEKEFSSLQSDCVELLKLLVSIIKTTKENIKK